MEVENKNDADDEIVQSIDVYNSKKLDETLCLMNFPQRALKKDYGEAACGVEARYKSKANKLQLRIPVETTSSNYNRTRGERIALNSEGSSSAQQQFTAFNSGYMDHQIYENSTGFEAPSSNQQYAVGVLKNGALHLNPVKLVLNMHSTYSYLNKPTDAVDPMSKSKSGDASVSESEPEAEIVRGRFATDEATTSRKKRLKNPAGSADDEEQWLQLVYHGDAEEHSKFQRTRLFTSANVIPVSKLVSVNDPDSYYKMLVPKCQESHEKSVTEGSSSVISLHELSKLSLSEQIKSLLVKAIVFRYDQLRSLLSPTADEMEILRHLQEYSVLVQGVFCVKSELLYPKGTVSSKTGVSADILARTRDYALYKFTQNRVLTRKEITDTLKSPPEDVYEILYSLSKAHSRRGFEFKYQKDINFIERFPEIVSRQNLLWESIINQLNASIKQQAKPTGRVRRRTESKSFSADSEPEIDGRRRRQTSSKQRRISTSLLNSPPKATNESKLIQNCPADENPVEAKESSDEDNDEKLRIFLIEIFKKSPLLNSAKLQSEITEADIKLCTNGENATEIIDVLSATMGVKKFVTSSNTMFAYHKIGDMDEVREIVLKLLSEKFRFKFSDLKKACVSELQNPPSGDEMKRIAMDYCNVKNSLFTLKES